MRVNRRYLVAVALLAVFAVAFGVFGTVAPPLAEETTPVQAQQESSSDSVAHFMYPPSYDSGWVDITTKNGQYFALKHGLNSTEVFVDVAGKQSLDPMGGALAWSKKYGGANIELAYSLVQTSDGGYALAGYNASAGGFDFCLVKADSAGNIEWSKNYGTAIGQETALSLVQTFDGGYALAGRNSSSGNDDFCLVKANSAGVMEWSENYGTLASDEEARSLVQTSDGGYALAGSNASAGPGDFCLVKVDSAGTMQWSGNYGIGDGDEWAYSLVQTGDLGYALAGGNSSSGNNDFCLVKVNLSGVMQWSKNYGIATDIEWAWSLVQTFDGGYALGGIKYYVGGYDFCLVKVDSAGVMQWRRTYGGTASEPAYSLVQTVDGGFALAGSNASAGSYDFCLVKVDSAGVMQWSRTYGGAGNEEARFVVQTSDGGFALAGFTNSFGDGYDFWLVKVKGEMDKEHKKYFGGTNLIPGWTGTYGGAGVEVASSLVQTFDGGYALAGYNGSAGYRDFCLVKVDSAGVMQWSKNYRGAGVEVASSLVQTSDGGYALAGYNYSAVSQYDFCLVKVNSAGVTEWSKNYGIAGSEEAHSIVQTGDGGFALAGSNVSAGSYDFCLVKVNSAGNLQWSKNYETAAGNEVAQSLVQTSDGGFALAGFNLTLPVRFTFCLVKVDSSGVMQWSKNYGAWYEQANSLVQTFDGGYALAGYNYSGGGDFCLVKVDSAGVMQWSKNYGGAGGESAGSLVQTSDGGYALAGTTSSFGAGGYDFCLVKVDSSGNMQWNRNYGGANDESAGSLVQTSDGGYALAGSTESFGAGGYDFWLVKTDVEMGLALTDVAKNAITLYRGKTDLYWNYVRVRIWTIKEPSWIYGDINMDGIVDAKDLYIIGRNYGKTFSLLSLTGIAAIAGIRTAKKRKQSKQPSYIS